VPFTRLLRTPPHQNSHSFTVHIGPAFNNNSSNLRTSPTRFAFAHRSLRRSQRVITTLLFSHPLSEQQRSRPPNVCSGPALIPPFPSVPSCCATTTIATMISWRLVSPSVLPSLSPPVHHLLLELQSMRPPGPSTAYGASRPVRLLISCSPPSALYSQFALLSSDGAIALTVPRARTVAVTASLR
jgi:hypothetical protein